MIPHRLGLYLAVVQFFFALTWTVYVIYLPRLAAQVGISGTKILLILLLDQLIFTFMDFSMGAIADRVARVVGRLSRVILVVTLASCLAFLLLPYTVLGSAALFFALTLLWTASSSVLRAPPLALLGKRAARPAVPWLLALTLFGLGVAGAVAPYLTIALRETDPRLPFALSSIALAAATLGIVWMERTLASAAAARATETKPSAARPPPSVLGFLFSVGLLGFGFQVHFALNSAPLYLRYAPAADLIYLMPVFWVGFNLLLLPAAFATQRWGGLSVMTVGGITGGIAALLIPGANNLTSLVALQFIMGGAWGCVLMSALAAALAIGHVGREGRITGAMFALLALATLARIAAVATGVNANPLFAAFASWAPPGLWLLAGLLLLLLLATQRKPIA